MGVDTAALLARIQALRSKTTDRGCTEQETLAAAAKAAELLDRYDLSLSKLELQMQPCVRAELPTGRSRIGPLEECAPALAALVDCRFWFETDAEGRLIQVFFGLPADVQAAETLMPLIARAFETEANRFRASADYLRGRSGKRRALHTSFVLGLSQGIQVKLAAMAAERAAARRTPSGRDLVIAKSGVVDAELDKLGLRFRSRNPAERLVNPVAFNAGQAAGEQFETT